MLLSRNTSEDRTRAIGYVEQAVHVLEDRLDDDAQVPLTLPSLSAQLTSPHEAYPTDERQWLLGTSYNTGIECLQRVAFSR